MFYMYVYDYMKVRIAFSGQRCVLAITIINIFLANMGSSPNLVATQNYHT